MRKLILPIIVGFLLAVCIPAFASPVGIGWWNSWEAIEYFDTPTVAETTKVTNLNADYLDGKDWPDSQWPPFIPGVLIVDTLQAGWYVDGDWEIISSEAYVETVPSDASVIIDLNVNGTTIFSSTKLVIADGANSGTGAAMTTTTLADGDRFSLDIDQVGSTIAGSDLYITVLVRRR